jgi:hypothetical protein
VTAGGTATANFALDIAATSLEAVTVTATASRSARASRGTRRPASSCRRSAFRRCRTSARRSQGRRPGVQVLASGGTAGTGSRIRVRGVNSLSLSNEPLIVVDGIG